jgi:hypothetical protein
MIDLLIRLIIIAVVIFLIWIGGLWLLAELGAAAVLVTIFKILVALVGFLAVFKEVRPLLGV